MQTRLKRGFRAFEALEWGVKRARAMRHLDLTYHLCHKPCLTDLDSNISESVKAGYRIEEAQGVRVLAETAHKALWGVWE